MLREAVPDFVNPENDNAISLVNALYVNALSARFKGAGVPDGVAAPDAELLARLKRCACPQGGFSWFEGMDASPSVTAMVLFRMARAGIDSALGEEIRSKACAFLDREQFAFKGKRPWWYGGISLENYLLVRSMYADLPLAASPDRESRKEISNFLVPRKKRGLNGAVLQKAERLYILMNLASGQDGKSQLSGQDGKSLAASLGIRVASAKRIYASISADSPNMRSATMPPAAITPTPLCLGGGLWKARPSRIRCSATLWTGFRNMSIAACATSAPPLRTAYVYG